MQPAKASAPGYYHPQFKVSLLIIFSLFFILLLCFICSIVIKIFFNNAVPGTEIPMYKNVCANCRQDVSNLTWPSGDGVLTPLHPTNIIQDVTWIYYVFRLSGSRAVPKDSIVSAGSGLEITSVASNLTKMGPKSSNRFKFMEIVVVFFKGRRFISPELFFETHFAL